MQGQWQGGKGSGRRAAGISYKEQCIRYDLAFRDIPEGVPCKKCGKGMLIMGDVVTEEYRVRCSNTDECDMAVEEVSASTKEAVIRWNNENK
tara:strand:- start:57 stop:332 length:276 start_codon:yes stop_codon:yes gene_type:complete